MNFAAFARRWNEILLGAFQANPRRDIVQIDWPGKSQPLSIREIPMQDAGTLLDHALRKADRRAMEHEIEVNFRGGLGEWQRQTTLLSQSRAVAKPVPGPAPDYWKSAYERGAQKTSREFGQAPPEAIPNVTDHNKGPFIFKADASASASPTPSAHRKYTTSECPCCGAATKHDVNCAFNALLKSQDFSGVSGRKKKQKREELKKQWQMNNQKPPLGSTSDSSNTGPRQNSATGKRSPKWAMNRRCAPIPQPNTEPSAAEALVSLALSAPSKTQAAARRAPVKRERGVIEVDDDDEERGGEDDGDDSSGDEIDITIQDERPHWGFEPPCPIQRRQYWHHHLDLNAAANSSTDRSEDDDRLLFSYYSYKVRAGTRYRCRPLEWFNDTNIEFFRLDYLLSGRNVDAARRAVLPGNFFLNRMTGRPSMGGAFPAVYDFDAALAYLGEANAAEAFEREARLFTRSFVRSSVRPSRLRTYLLG